MCFKHSFDISNTVGTNRSIEVTETAVELFHGRIRCIAGLSQWDAVNDVDQNSPAASIASKTSRLAVGCD